ncbi:VOC family protein [Ktedonobacter racemifer]|uniref:Glyoxalase/bleomycin resistance protein/dioxygenase n=1 Tax=Ktedonobacter racemifer DSM 44963 TaxID=485913 RepID=D6TLD2_KTERA|nr:VOC family protein [Ktedonobacter racemifer]EFH86582.1 Glyoxalase/bleomycin resistance protein/dioxygenase [Ktedonobacter racemifer DSM 44963]
MKSPIQNRVTSVFVHVTDMQRSSKWYNELLGVSQSSTTHEGTIYDVPMDRQHSPFLTLDANVTLTQPDGRPPLLMLETADIEAAHDFLVARDIELVSDIEDIGSMYFLAFKDPDGNVLLVSQKK